MLFLMALVVRLIACSAYEIEPSLILQPNYTVLQLTVVNSSIANPSLIKVKSFSLYTNNSGQLVPTPTNATKILVVYPQAKSVLVFIQRANLSVFDQYTVQITDINVFRDSQSNPPARIRFSFFNYGAFITGSNTKGSQRTFQFQFLTFFQSFAPLQNLSIWISIVLIYVVFYTTIQRRQFIYPLLYMVSFAQVMYWLSLSQTMPGVAVSYLVGFRYAHFKFFPNFFSATVPNALTDFISNSRFYQLVLDNNMIRNCGEAYSLWLIIIPIIIFYMLMERQGRIQLITDGIRKLQTALTMVFMFTWPNAFFFSFSDFYSKQGNLSTFSSFPQTSGSNFVLSTIIFLLLGLAPALIFAYKYFRIGYNKFMLIELMQNYKKVGYGILIIAVPGTGLLAIPAIQIVYGVAMLEMSREKLVGLFVQLLVVISYFLVIFISEYNVSMIVISCGAFVAGLMHQLYMIWGEKFFDIWDEKRIITHIQKPKNVTFQRAFDSEKRLEGILGFDQVETD